MRVLIFFLILLILVVSCMLFGMGVGGMIAFPGLRQRAFVALEAAENSLLTPPAAQKQPAKEQAIPTPLLLPSMTLTATASSIPTLTLAPAATQDPNLLPPGYVLVEQRAIGLYYYQLGSPAGAGEEWQEESTYFALALSDQPGVRLFELSGSLVGLDIHSGMDLTGEGNPDILVMQFSGGAHCCFNYFLLDLGAQAVSNFLQTAPSNCTAELNDLDGDQVYEFLTCDDLLAYRYCSFAASPMAPVVLSYQVGKGYRPATPLFKEWPEFQEKVAIDTWQAEAWMGMEASQVDADEDILCPALQVGLDYLYLGEEDKARAEFLRLNPQEGAQEIWQEVIQAVNQSWYYWDGK
jgi:hypothetical protein